MDILKLRGAMPRSVSMDICPAALSKWNPALRADESDATISILDVIGQDYFGEGVTAQRISAALRSIGSDKDVTVNINSPGGDMFEGLAIHSLLSEHKGKVTVKVIGLAASAASIIAMAADEIVVSRAGFLMIHNAWIFAAGNRNELRAAAEWLEPFDLAMAGIYQHRTGINEADIIEMMDAETWLGAQDAINKGFADSIMGDDPVEGDANAMSGVRKIDLALAKAGVSRAERRKMINDLKQGTHDAALCDTHDAIACGEVTQISAQLRRIIP